MKHEVFQSTLVICLGSSIVECLGFFAESPKHWRDGHDTLCHRKARVIFMAFIFLVQLGGGFQLFCIFTPIWRKIPILTNIFQLGWKHHLVFGIPAHICIFENPTEIESRNGKMCGCDRAMLSSLQGVFPQNVALTPHINWHHWFMAGQPAPP